jgi:hypothetical protein
MMAVGSRPSDAWQPTTEQVRIGPAGAGKRPPPGGFGTRVTVELILEKLAARETMEQLLEAHPRLTREGIQAALAFAARSLKADVVYPVK